MARSARARLATMLRGSTQVSSSCETKLDPGAMDVHVEGFGRVTFPVGPSKARKLIELARPARFGRGEETLTDPEIRDTWEIPKHLVRAEWDPGALGDVLTTVKDKLGLPNDSHLTAELHSLLVYETGQFFVPHQDSEKADGMIGTLVVTLPSTYYGGELVVSADGEQKSYAESSRWYLSAVAFYADCRHEVRKVTKGYRITLTYNLILDGEATSPDGDEGTITELASYLREHFRTPPTVDSENSEYPRYYRYRGGYAADPPIRLVFLLDHEYTPRALSWPLLKGADADRAALLREAAARAGCETVLALTDIDETHGAHAIDERDFQRRRSWMETNEVSERDRFDLYSDGEQGYEVAYLMRSAARLTHWTGSDGAWLEETSLPLRDTEMCAATKTDELTPYQSSFKEYLGNEGNTLDRQYHRAAIVVWPRDRAFANHAETSRAWALDEIVAMTSSGGTAMARAAAETLSSFWGDGPLDRTTLDETPLDQTPLDQTPEETGECRVLLGKALRAANAVDDARTAAMLLCPFTLRHLTDASVDALAVVAGQYGPEWTASLLRTWYGAGWPGNERQRVHWMADQLPGLCSRLHDAGGAGTTTARQLLDVSWARLRTDAAASLARPDNGCPGDFELLGNAVAAVLTAAAAIGAVSTRDAVSRYMREQGDHVAALELYIVRAAGNTCAHGARHDTGFGDLADDCAARLNAWLAQAS